MIYAPIELCHTFLDREMVSEGEYMWITYSDGTVADDVVYGDYLGSGYKDATEAFHPWDLVGSTEEAKRNAQVWWGLIPTYEAPCDFCENQSRWLPAWEYHRHAALDAEDFWAYVQQTQGGR